jgi:hypothetical protein
MKQVTAISIIAVSVLALTSLPATAFQGGGGGGGAGGGDHSQTMDRDYDRDRMQDRTRLDTPDMDRDRDELKKYREQLKKNNSYQARESFQMQHEKTMQQRALKQAKDLVPPGQGPIYGGEFMSVQERNTYREQLRRIGAEKEQMQFQAQHKEKMDTRAEALELEVEEAE